MDCLGNFFFFMRIIFLVKKKFTDKMSRGVIN